MRSLWSGEYPLRTAFWKFFVGGSIFFFLLCFGLGAAFYLVGLRPLMVAIFAIGLIAYPLFASVGVWRSAIGGTYADLLAKGIVLIIWGRFLWWLANGGAQNTIGNFMSGY